MSIYRNIRHVTARIMAVRKTKDAKTANTGMAMVMIENRTAIIGLRIMIERRFVSQICRRKRV